MRTGSQSPPSPPGDSLTARERLLDAAERLFADRGFAAASIREITTAAGQNVAAVNYHFRGKGNLYLEVFRRRLGIVRDERVGALNHAMAEAGETADVELVVRTFTTTFLEPFLAGGDGPLLLRLIAREMADPRLPHRVFADELMMPLMQAAERALGRVAPTLPEAPRRLAIHSLVAQLVHVVHVRRLGERDGLDPFNGVGRGGIVDHIVRFTTAGIRALALPEAG